MIFEAGGAAATVLSWSPPTTRTDGSAYGAPQHAGYELGVNSSGTYESRVSVPAAFDVTTWSLNDLNITDAGDYDVALRAVDTSGNVSAWSNSTTFTARFAPPSAPTNFTIG